jgi:hypothetical protein
VPGYPTGYYLDSLRVQVQDKARNGCGAGVIHLG